MTRWRAAVLSGLVALLAVWGVGPNLAPTASQAQAQDQGSVCVYFDQTGQGDLSFNDMAALGAERAAEEFGLNVEFTTAQSEASYLPDLQSFARSGDCVVIIGVGFLLQDALPQAASQFPDQNFALIDGTSQGQSNVLGVLFREQEAGAPVGALAALVAIAHGDPLIGAIGGAEIPPVWRYEAGYRFGAHWAADWYNTYIGSDASIGVRASYVGRFDDPASGKTTAEALLNAGARNILGIAGASHLGMFDAIEEANNAAGNDVGPPFGYGADASQEWVKPGYILASGRKRVDVGTATAIEQAVEGTFSGGDIVLGIDERGTGVSSIQDVKDFIDIAVDAGQLEEDQTEQALQRIIDARASVPAYAWIAVDALTSAIEAGTVELPDADTADQIQQVREEYP